ncbi:hypothetical protein HX834_05980 [Marine Group I thaumarchaeote]|uniref:Uncharacterized protein n=1 Tax=Marine Group I thaumarchaeote TaxID=2511932 RepID=A0A7K4N066_9ARCH|nr:hypothetical protein [Marine Group I thaumarchaeote]
MKISGQIKFVIKSCAIFSILSFGFSLTGFLFPDDSSIIGDPLIVSNPSLEHILGHVFFGMIAGVLSLRLKYVFLIGAFALLLDADHLLQFFNVEMISRMVHSVPFAIIIAVIMLYVFGKKDYRLAAISFSAIISHIAFDVWFAGQIYPGSTGGFPLFSPFTVEIIRFQGLDWLYLEILAIVIVGIIAILDRKISIKNHIEK